jgi:DNA mismatch repair protein MutL
VLLPVDEARDGMAIGGYVCSPAVTRATAAHQTLVVNHRPVGDPVLRTAVRVAYRDVIAAGRHPMVALYLTLPPDALDVNVHPAKTELRFRDAAAVRSLVIGAVRRALGAASGQVVPMASVGSFASWSRAGRPVYPPPLALGAARGNLAEASLPFVGAGQAVPGGSAALAGAGSAGLALRGAASAGSAFPGAASAELSFPGAASAGLSFPGAPSPESPFPGAPSAELSFPGAPSAELSFPGAPSAELSFPGAPSAELSFPGAPSAELSFPGAPSAELSFPGAPSAELSFPGAPSARQIDPVAAADYPLGAPVAQVLDTYIIAVAADGALVLVDQHAAHERLTHEAMRMQMLQGGVRSQALLLPAVVDLPCGAVALLAARAADLARLGLELEEFGAGAILVRAMPAVLGAPEPAPLLRDLADELAAMDEQTVLSARLDAIIARMACHASIRAGRRLGQAEMSALLRQMEATPRAATCSHGRPTVLKLSKADIERLFGRR